MFFFWASLRIVLVILAILMLKIMHEFAIRVEAFALLAIFLDYLLTRNLLWLLIGLVINILCVFSLHDNNAVVITNRIFCDVYY